MTGADRFTASVCLARGGFGLFSVSKWARRCAEPNQGWGQTQARIVTSLLSSLHQLSSSTGAGNLVVTGFTQMSARGASGDFGTANWSVGAGTLTAVGVALYSAHISRVSGPWLLD
jgi:hypothetical protein